MKNKRNPIFQIEGTSFEVDVETQRLIEKNNSGNTISFIEQMTDHFSHYDLAFDPKTKTAFDRTNDFEESEKYTMVRVPKLVELDPEGMAEKYGFTVDQLKDKTDFEVIVNQEALAQRHAGLLPKIDIAGDTFIVDLRLQEMRDIKNHFPPIRFKDLHLTGDGMDYVAFYHPATKQVVELDPRLTEFPEGVVKIQLPGLIVLDPVATAREYKLDEYDLLRRYPIRKDLKADVTPLSETGVPAMIQINKEQLKREHQENAKRIKPKHRPRF